MLTNEHEGVTCSGLIFVSFLGSFHLSVSVTVPPNWRICRRYTGTSTEEQSTPWGHRSHLWVPLNHV